MIFYDVVWFPAIFQCLYNDSIVATTCTITTTDTITTASIPSTNATFVVYYSILQYTIVYANMRQYSTVYCNVPYYGIL